MKKICNNNAIRFIAAMFVRLFMIIYGFVLFPVWILSIACFYVYFFLMLMLIPLVWIFGGRRLVLFYKIIFLCYKIDGYSRNNNGDSMCEYLRKELETNSPDSICGSYEYEFIYDWFENGLYALRMLARNLYEEKILNDKKAEEEHKKYLKKEERRSKILAIIDNANTRISSKYLERNDKQNPKEYWKKYDEYYAYVDEVAHEILKDDDVRDYCMHTQANLLREKMHDDLYRAIAKIYCPTIYR